MKSMQDILAEQYTRHYSRGNVNMDPRKISPIIWNEMDQMFGPFVANLPDGSRVLDLGCGIGFFLYWLSSRKNIVPFGVDYSPSQVAAARGLLPNVEIVESDGLEFLKRNQSSFDGIYCLDVLEHIPGDQLCFEWVVAARKALKPGGFFFCRLPNAANITGSYIRYIDYTHERSFTSISLMQFLEATGLENCGIVPVEAYHWKGKIRQSLLNAIHRFMFRLSLHGPESEFSSVLQGVGYVPEEE